MKQYLIDITFVLILAALFFAIIAGPMFWWYATHTPECKEGYIYYYAMRACVNAYYP